MSLPIDELVETLKRLAPTIPAATLIAIENDLEAKEAEVAAEKADATPKAKNQLAVVLLDPEGRLAAAGLTTDFTGLVVQIPEADDTGTILERIAKATYAQNASGKTRKAAIFSVAGAAEGVKRKWFKDVGGIQIKTKTPVRIIVTDGIIPKA